MINTVLVLICLFIAIILQSTLVIMDWAWFRNLEQRVTRLEKTKKLSSLPAKLNKKVIPYVRPTK
jgi:hypothetical protein